MNKLTAIDKYAARLLMVSFFLPLMLQVVAVVMACGYLGFRTVQSGQRIPRSNFLWALLLGSGFLLYLLAIPLTPGIFQPRLLTICTGKMSLLLMPFTFAIIVPAFGNLIKRELVWFVYACLVSCVLANVAVLYSYTAIHGNLHGLTHVGYREGFESNIGIHPTYMAMYLGFSMCIVLYTDGVSTRQGRIIRYCMLYMLLLFFMALLAKAPLIALIAIGLHYAVTHRTSLYRYKSLFIGFLLAIAAAWVYIPFISQRVNEAVQMISSSKNTSVIDNSVSARKLIWNTDMTLLRHYWLTGVGPGRVYQTFQQRYLFYSLAYGPIGIIHDPHNEYIFEWLAFGIIGFILFAVIFLACLVRAIRHKNYLYLYLLFILYITFFTETVLATQRGVLFYAVFTAFFFFLASQRRAATVRR